MQIAIQGIGVVGGFGTGVTEMRQALLTGTSNRATLDLSNCGTPLNIPAFRANISRLTDYVPLKALRRVDNFSKLALLGAYLALEDAGVLAEGKQERLGVVIASGYGATGITFAFLDSFINDGDICASPTYFANSVHNSAAAYISIMLGATGPSSTVSQFHHSVPSALQTAWLWLAEGRVDRVLFGAVEELSELIGYAWYRQRGTAHKPEMTPLLTGVESAIPGEGAAFLLLTRKEEAQDGYCLLDRVTTGRLLKPGFLSSPQDLLVLGADGRIEKGGDYAQLAEKSTVACFTALYGSMPCGPALDIAIAALMLKEGKTFASPGGGICDFPASVAAGGNILESHRVSCLSLSDEDCFGLVSLAKG
ncbi:MAG: beta-ketoacyl synthase N-terminal-like domain-containing protein [Desulfuromonadaceae bacterium]|nr:beta-ketoacyl synthase N-terminal-like domain-containing protein [Desulfuromonadaceae bacterium]